MRFSLSDELLSELRERRSARGVDAGHRGDLIEEENDAFLLDPGMGPSVYLTADGRVLIDGECRDGQSLREATDDEATRYLVVGAKKTGIADLLDLIPARTAGGLSCSECASTRWSRTFAAHSLEIVCFQCHGRGWVDPGR